MILSFIASKCRGDRMAEIEMINNLIDVYINLQRIDIADDTKKEIDNQIRAVKAKLES